ncbi:uncharacterized protein LOC127261977 isoform X2 [Andrographis paniculata]|uniref:uncharacterized protein LOC127261977 isoform X2 n=1 Tax=Andrographis paniculata TaxID=175694 RepID=UPI0021E7EB3C|nr:uncharacterized protein LOC127261977 isoform X2 [Andrographis paniculata]
MALPVWFNLRRAASPLSGRLPVVLRNFRSDAALEALLKASENKTPNLVLYKYPSFSGAYAALFAHLYHSQLNIPCVILPFSAVVPLRVEDLCIEGLETCYFLDFLGLGSLASELTRRTSSKIIGFDHRKSTLSRISTRGDCDANITLNANTEKSSCMAAYEYFSAKLSENRFENDNSMSLLDHKDRERVETILKYIDDRDLRSWSLPDAKAFNIGVREWHSKLLEICPTDLITRGNDYLSRRKTAAKKLLHKVFRVKLGRGIYGECLGFRADGHSDLSDEIGKELSQMSAAAGLRPIGAVTYMQRNNLKMCLRTTDCSTDTSEVAKAYGGGGSPSSSSFIIRMDEYNHWISGRHDHGDSTL